MLLLLACAADPDPKLPADSGDDADTGDTLPPGADCNAELPAEDGVVHTTSGAWRGSPSGGATAWLGIPFAEPPLGSRRFAPPEARACATGITDAAAFGPLCVQEEGDDVVGDEDCLQLNVWAPPGATGDTPVLFFLHGGGNVAGGTAQTDNDVLLYDGAELASRMDAVVVTANYRLGAFGFLAHPTLQGPDGENGNWGLQDQTLALRWVHDNVRGFGGDPDQVLLFGESAGALDTCAHLAAPASAGLFSAALMESGACFALSLDEAEDNAATHAVTLGCDGAADIASCLRDADPAAIAALSESPISDIGIPSGHSFGPTEDGVVLPGPPGDVIADGSGADVPLVIGTNADETAQWIPTLTEEEYESLVTLVAGRYADDVLTAYPVADYDSARDAWIALTTDVSFTCPARTIARAAASAQTAPVYRYRFSKVPTGASGIAYGSWHGLELVYVFQHLDAVQEATGYRPDDADAIVEAAMGASWRALAAAGDPNAPELGLDWSAYDPASDRYFDFGEPLSTGDGLRTAQCDFWDSFQ